jgi:hypothetical protein
MGNDAADNSRDTRCVEAATPAVSLVFSVSKARRGTATGARGHNRPCAAEIPVELRCVGCIEGADRNGGVLTAQDQTFWSVTLTPFLAAAAIIVVACFGSAFVGLCVRGVRSGLAYVTDFRREADERRQRFDVVLPPDHDVP